MWILRPQGSQVCCKNWYWIIKAGQMRNFNGHFDVLLDIELFMSVPFYSETILKWQATQWCRWRDCMIPGEASQDRAVLVSRVILWRSSQKGNQLDNDSGGETKLSLLWSQVGRVIPGIQPWNGRLLSNDTGRIDCSYCCGLWQP